MHTVGLGGQGHVQVVIDDEGYAGLGADLPQSQGRLELGALGPLLVPELDESGAPGDGLAGDLFLCAPRGRRRVDASFTLALAA